ncbi:hypothetical protein [Cellvibrio mixtus]|uniref:hypothetical protein n=1 Tax=Cellvibrio mixtus TaxID=39650 RepID=UPI0005879893|nr:hypothetical protein [Cellvibrio mixtus]
MKKSLTIINRFKQTSKWLLATSLMCGLPVIAQEFSEGNVAAWGAFADDNAAANVYLDSARVKDGSSSIRLETASGFGTGVRYPASANLNFNASGKTHLGFWLYTENPNAGVAGSATGFQGNQPIVTLTTSGGSYTYTPTQILIKNNSWVYYEIPLAGNQSWIRTSTGTPNLADVDQIEIKADTWEYGFTANIDGVKFLDGPKGYVESKVLVVYYMDANSKPKLPVNIEGVFRPKLNKVTEFYWRNSGMSYLVTFDTQPVYINQPANVQVDNEGWVKREVVESDLRALGYLDNQYDAVMVVSRSSANAAYWEPVLGNTPYFSVGFFDDIQDNLFVTIHEFNHVVDSFFASNGFAKYPHAHPSDALNQGEFVPDSGIDADLNAKIIRHWGRDNFLLLGASQSAESKIFEDTDNDGVPNGIDLPITEARLGSSPNNKDADKDGLTDLEEAMAGIYSGTNPNAADTDSDGVNDKLDAEPLYAINQNIPFGTLNVNADISTWPKAGTQSFIPAGNTSDLHIGADANYLYVGAKVQGDQPNLRVTLDPGADGFFYGYSNLHVVLTPGGFDSNQYMKLETFPNASGVYSEVGTWLPVTGFQGRRVANGGWTTFQLAIPKSALQNLLLVNGDKIGVGVSTEVPAQSSLTGSIFETADLVPFSLTGAPDICTLPQWSSASPYGGNTVVQYSGKKYRAKWWTLNERPDLNSGVYHVWENLGACNN